MRALEPPEHTRLKVGKILAPPTQEQTRFGDVVDPRYIPTESQLADWMTKGLVEHKFNRFRSKLMLNVPLLFKSK